MLYAIRRYAVLPAVFPLKKQDCGKGRGKRFSAASWICHILFSFFFFKKVWLMDRTQVGEIVFLSRSNDLW
ncbi:MAG: hypothetical protein VB099_17705 [Candidatus Limiplasma sp.]|nr:hypothetical protein [Candidatus Limiplasma sp.]